MALPAGKRTFKNHIEIFEVTRPVSAIVSGNTLRIVDREHFRVVYTLDNWATTLSTEAHSVGYPGSFVDISAAPGPDGDVYLYPGMARRRTSRKRWLGKILRCPSSLRRHLRKSRPRGTAHRGMQRRRCRDAMSRFGLVHCHRSTKLSRFCVARRIRIFTMQREKNERTAGF